MADMAAFVTMRVSCENSIVVFPQLAICAFWDRVAAIYVTKGADFWGLKTIPGARPGALRDKWGVLRSPGVGRGGSGVGAGTRAGRAINVPAACAAACDANPLPLEFHVAISVPPAMLWPDANQPSGKNVVMAVPLLMLNVLAIVHPGRCSQSVTEPPLCRRIPCCLSNVGMVWMRAPLPTVAPLATVA